MPLLESIANFLKHRLVYMTGRGLLSMGLLAVAFTAPGIGLGTLAVAAIGLTGVLQGALLWRDQRLAEGRILQHYRDEVAAVVGSDPAQVSLADLHAVARGDTERGIEANPVIAQAINRSGERKLLRLGSTIASAVLTLGAVFLLLPLGVIESASSAIAGVTAGTPLAPSNLTVFGAMLVSGIGMGLLNNVLDFGAEQLLGFNRPTAHSEIKSIKLDIRRGKNITEERVFGVFVCADHVLARSIEESFGQPYDKLSPLKQHAALKEFGRYYPIEQLTQDINSRVIEADELAFAAVGQQSGVPRKAVPQKLQPLSAVSDAVQVISHAIDERTVPQQSVAEGAEAPAAATPSFASKYVPPTDSIGHVQRELQRREALLDAMPTLGVTRH